MVTPSRSYASATTSTPSATPVAMPTSRSARVRCSSEDREIECWKHGSTFSLETGEPQTLPATQPVPVYEARVEDGEIVVVVGSATRRTGRRAGHARHPRAAGVGRRHRDPPRHRSDGVLGRGARGHGPQRRRQVDPLRRRDGQAWLRGARRIGHARRPGRARHGALRAGSGRPVPRHAVPDRGARCGPERHVDRGAQGPGPGDRRARHAAADGGRPHRLRRALPRPAAQRRPVRRREEAQRDAAARRPAPSASPSWTSWTPAWTWTRCGRAPAVSRRPRTRTASASSPSPTTTDCSTS